MRHCEIQYLEVVRCVIMVVSNSFYETNSTCMSLILNILSSDSFQDFSHIHSFIL